MLTTKEIIEMGKENATESQLLSIKEEVDKVSSTFSVIKEVIKNRLLYNIGATYLSQTRSSTWNIPFTISVYLGITSSDTPEDFVTILPENYYER